MLDSFAILALIQNEPGKETIAELVERAEANESTLLMSLINWGEILYTLEREQGVERLAKLKKAIEEFPISLTEVTRTRVESAAHIKSQHRVSYADAFAIALAQELGATIVTGDPEFKSVEQQVPILWLNP
ncbi:MAG: type II toxin-antitoxin system VapC family toxin [Chloroflexi bacterium]|nr:type II toxin-antitoxin system VapC family toxin [Chloroflexota bacterium]